MKRTASRLFSGVLTVCLCSGACLAQNRLASSSGAAGENAAPKIAFTFDDLPAHGPLPQGETRLGIITKIIRALREGHVPPTWGFVNGRLIEDQPADASVLKAWREAGYPLGNHAWSHMNLNQRSLADWEADVAQNEATMATWMKGENWHWFRYPYLSEGDTPEKREGARKFLAQKGYKIATVTMSFGDYQWSDAYARCLTKGDQSTIKALKDSYLKAAGDSVPYYREISKSLYGRDIPYVLLMHVGAATADMLPQLIELYRSKGVQFVSLEQAEQDAFYKIDMDPSLPAGPDLLENAARERNVPLPTRPEVPLQFDSLCR